jgi:hypothetical protein
MNIITPNPKNFLPVFDALPGFRELSSNPYTIVRGFMRLTQRQFGNPAVKGWPMECDALLETARSISRKSARSNAILLCKQSKII